VVRGYGRRILVVDDDPEIATMLGRSLARHGFEPDITSSPSEALSLAGGTRYDAAVLDLVMPERDGADLAAALRQSTPGLPIALLTGYTRSPLLETAQGPGIGVFAKPVAIQDVVDFLETELG
jgi:DNA-binding response OmpR family regulator